MRIKVLIKTSKLPILYRNRFVALIKEALSISNKSYKEYLYEDEKFSKKVKPFSFAVILPKEKKVEKEKFLIDENFEIKDIVFILPENSFLSFIISSSDFEFMANLYNGFVSLLEQRKNFRFNNEISLEIIKIIPLNEKDINSDKMKFRTLSPVLIEDKEGNPILKNGEFPFEKFNTELNIIQDKIFKDLRGYGLKKELIFKPLDYKKQVVKHTFKDIREKLGKPYATLTCFEGCFELEGDPEDINFVYQNGLGLRTSQGFGMIEKTWRTS